MRALLGAVLTLGLAGCFAAPPQIIALQPNQGSTGVDADAVITVTFDRDIDRSSLTGRFHVSPPLSGCTPETAMEASPDAACSIRWLDNRPGFAFEHRGAVFAPDTTYTFRLDAGIRDQSGSVNGLDHTWQIRSAPAPTVRSTHPADGDTAVAADGALAVQFDRPMDTTSTEAAITLSPAVPGDRVVANRSDPSRFLLLPGALLQTGASYTLTVAATARDAHGQALALPRQVRFRAGGLSSGPHVLTLAGPPNRAATTGYLSQLAPLQAGDPVSTTLVVSAGSPAYPAAAIASAALSPGAERLAVALAGNPSTVIVTDTLSGRRLSTYTDARLPSWSAHGALALVTSTGITVVDPDGTTWPLVLTGTIVAPPVWNPAGTLLAVTVSSDGGATTRVLLASPSLDAVYPVPGLAGPASHPVFSRNGAALTVSVPGSGGPVAWAVDLGGAKPRQTATDCLPLGFTADSALVCLAGTATGSGSLVRVDSNGATAPIGAAANNGYVDAVVVSPDGRQLCYLGTDNAGVVQGWIETVDGGTPTQLTGIAPDSLAAQALSISP